MQNLAYMPGKIHLRGSIRHCCYTAPHIESYESVHQTTGTSLDKGTCVGIGGDPIHGMNFVDVLSRFRQMNQTKGIVMVGEIGGGEEKMLLNILKPMLPQASSRLYRRINRSCWRNVWDMPRNCDGWKRHC